MLSGNLFQFDDFHPNSTQNFPQDTTSGAFGDLREYLSSDLKLSDGSFSDLFSEFDLNPNDFQSLDVLATQTGFNQQQTTSTDLPPPAYETIPLTNNFDHYLSTNDVKPFADQQHSFQYETSTSNFSETSSIFSTDSTTRPTKKQSQTKRPRAAPPVHLPKLIKKPEPIPVTFDQFQALICSTPETNATRVGNFSTILENSTIIGNNIPLKIVAQTNNFSSDENSRHDSPLSSQSGATSNTSVNFNGTGRVRRKSSHNAIEKRYRSSINERILELKEMVADNDEKVQKSGVLRRTVEYIRQLQSTNRRLEEENRTLKTILQRLNIPNVEIVSNEDSPSSNSSVKNITTPPSSHDDSSDESFSPVPKRQKRTTSKQGMVNGSRLVLCCFMLCVLITNPFSYFLNLIHSADLTNENDLRTIVNSRTLQSTSKSNDDFLSTSWRQLVAWMLNLAICLVCLVKLFVYGEPILSEVEMQKYSIEKKKADQLMSENLPNEAKSFYRNCCEKLGFKIDETFLFYLSSITWQMTRFCVNLIFVGRWLTFWAGWTKSIDTRDYNRELNDCLLQLWKIELKTRSKTSSNLSLFNLFISTLNTLTNGGKKISRTRRNEIYFLAALTSNRFGGIFSIFVRFFLRSLDISDLNEFWLADIDRLVVFIDENDEKLPVEQNDFLVSIRREFFKFNLFETIRNQLENPAETMLNQMKMPIDLDDSNWWQHVLYVIRSISQTTPTDRPIEFVRNEQFSERYASTIETIEKILSILENDEEQKKTTSFSLLEELGRASRSIDDLPEDHSQLDLAVRTLILDGILSLRLRLLTKMLNNVDGKLPFLDDFQHELDQYRPAHRQMKLPKQRLNLFESIFRVASGLNPLQIQTLFESSIKSIETTSVDVLSALLIFCHFAPSTVFYYRNIFQRSTASIVDSKSKANQDFSRLRQQSLTVIRQQYLTL